MSLSNTKDSFNNVSKLIHSLLEGMIEISDFSLQINQESPATARNLFRDTIPKFSSNVKEKFTDTFSRYFFNDVTISANSLWKFVTDTDFWHKIKQFHDTTYTRNMAFSEIINYFDRNLANNHKGLKLNQLEKEVLERINNDPYLLYKTVANELKITEKKVSTIINQLRHKGIFLGSSIDYAKLGFFEFFAFRINNEIRNKTLLIEEINFFPHFKLYRGISKDRILDDSIYSVSEKNVIYNSKVMNMGISICDWSDHTRFRTQVSDSVNVNQPDFSITDASTPYIIELLKNCEANYKRPNINKISEENDVSVRTLFRIKSKLTDSKIIEPKLFVDSNDLMNVVVISNKQIDEIYKKVPFVHSYQINNDNVTMWLSFLSIFISDFRNLYLLLKDKAEIFQIINKKLLNTLSEDSLPIFPMEHKVYTK